MKSREVAEYGLMVALAMVLSYVEAQMPVFFAVPGMKLGLTNLVVLIALVRRGEKSAFFINLVRIVLTAFTFGSMSAMLYSLAGGIASFLVMVICRRSRKFSLAGVSVAGGIAHNAGQILVAMFALETARLMLRPIRMSDARDVFAYASDPEVARHVLWDAHLSLADSREYIRFLLDQYHTGTPSTWAIWHKADARVIGTIGYMGWSDEHRVAEIGYSIGRAWWHQGIMPEALSAVISVSFTMLSAHRLECLHETDNPASGRVMEKCGMMYEGVLRGRVMNKGSYSDVAIYALLREDWHPDPAHQPRLL